MVVLNVTDIEFEEYRVYRETDADGVVHVWATAGFRVVTAEGQDFTDSITVELTGPAKTRAGALLADIKTLARAKRGLP